MGILNVTPDSFSDGGTHATTDAAVAAGLAMTADGAAIIDVGGESTRPGSPLVPADQEQIRVIPVIRALAERGVVVSVDTRNASTMDAALNAGARIVNDVSALSFDPAAARLVGARGCPVVLMHMRGTPATMRSLAVYDDVATEMVSELSERAAAAMAAGIARDAIMLDPGIGFAKAQTQSLAALRALPRLIALGFPMLVGVSRKSFIGAITGEPEPARRLPGSIAAGLFALMQGAAILRVHDVRETVQAIRMWQALQTDGLHAALPSEPDDGVNPSHLRITGFG